MPQHQDLVEEIQIFDPSRPIEDNFTPPASWYTNTKFHNLERDTVFSNHWLFVGRLDQVAQPGDYFTGSYLGKPYVVTRDQHQDLHAFYNVCSHHGTCVAEGEGRTEALVCPYHGWTYGMDGRLRRAPMAGRIQDLVKKNLDLKPVPVTTWGPFVLACFSEQPPDLDIHFAALDQDLADLNWHKLTFTRRVNYTIDCNWKVFIDNYLDGGYHVPHMHKDLSGNLDIAGYQSRIGDCYSVQTCPGDGASDRLGDMAVYAWIYPNFMLNRYGPWLDTNLVLPLSPDRCAVVFDYYYEGPVAPDVLAKALADSNQVQQEDITVCDRVQAGLQSGVYHRGVYAPRFEKPMYHFHQLLARDLRGAVS